MATTTYLQLNQPPYNSAAWDVPLNANETILDNAFGATTSVSLTNSNVTLTASQLQAMQFRFTGAISASIIIYIPAGYFGRWTVTNATTGAYTLTMASASGGTTVAIPQGYSSLICCDSTGVFLSDSGIFQGGVFSNITVSGTANISTGNITTSTITNLTVSSVGQINSLGVGTAASGTTGEIRATNNVTAYYSDDRLKTRLGAINDPVQKVKSLSGFYYEANEIAQSLGYESIREVGISAQDVQAIMPEVVAPAPIDEQYLTVRYERLVPLLIEAIKELSEKVERLEKGNA